MSVERIPLVDLTFQSDLIADEVGRGFQEVIATSAFIGGPAVAEFEAELAAYCGVEHSVGVANGTDAIELALRAAGIEPGDEVILPTNSFIATAEAVTRAGGRPVLVDCDPDDLLIDPAAVATSVSSSTRAVVPVHLYGRLAPMEELQAAVGDRPVAMIEDAAQAQGARRNGRGIGSWGRAAATSFYPGKNLGAYGDGGAVLTNDAAIAADVRSRRDHGRAGRHHHELVGTNSRLDTLQAVVLRAKLRHLHEWNELRTEAAARYQEMLSDFPGVTVPRLGREGEPVWHLYVVRVRDRDAVLAALHEAGIGAGVHYLVPIHLQPAFAYLGYSRGDFPVAEAAAHEILSLPLYPGITAAQQLRVCEALRSAVARHAA
jgi:dTDP-4-amino-4,6-dideoxygalactose transaminase